MTVGQPLSPSRGHGHYSTAAGTVDSQCHCAVAMVTVPWLGTPQNSQDTLPLPGSWCCSKNYCSRVTVLLLGIVCHGQGCGVPCKGHHPMLVSLGNGKGCLGYGPVSSWAVGRRAMPWLGAQGLTKLLSSPLVWTLTIKSTDPFCAQTPRKEWLSPFGDPQSPGARRALRPGMSQGSAGHSPGPVAKSRGHGLAAALCCCTLIAGARKGK